MTLAIALGIALIVFFVVRSLRRGKSAHEGDTSKNLEAWIADALERELAAQVLGMRASTEAERKPLAQTLRGNPDVSVVSAIEEAVKSVEIEFLRYAHEKDAEVTLRVKYENGKANTAATRLAWSDLPPSVRCDFETKSATRVFRPWAFPWSRT